MYPQYGDFIQIVMCIFSITLYVCMCVPCIRVCNTLGYDVVYTMYVYVFVCMYPRCGMCVSAYINPHHHFHN